MNRDATKTTCISCCVAGTAPRQFRPFTMEYRSPCAIRFFPFINISILLCPFAIQFWRPVVYPLSCSYECPLGSHSWLPNRPCGSSLRNIAPVGCVHLFILFWWGSAGSLSWGPLVGTLRKPHIDSPWRFVCSILAIFLWTLGQCGANSLLKPVASWSLSSFLKTIWANLGGLQHLSWKFIHTWCG